MTPTSTRLIVSQALRNDRSLNIGINSGNAPYTRSSSTNSFPHSPSSRVNPLKYLAECYTSPLKVTYDGSTNYIGPTPLDSRYMLVQQYQYVAAMLGELSRRLGDALPDHVVSTEENVRLRRIELCRDRATANSRGAAILLSHSVLRETRRVGRDVYSAGSTDDDGLPVTRWWRKRKGVAHKVYAKAPKDVGGSGCVREEVSCQGHTALQELDCVSRAEWTSEGVTELLTGFVEAALPILNTLHAHVTAVMAGSATPADLFVALSPLVMAMSGAPTGGRPTSPEQVAQLRSAFDSIVLTGQYHGKGLKKGLTLRSLFDALCDPKGPLEKNPLLCLYTLKPQFARASHAMMQAVDHGVRKG